MDGVVSANLLVLVENYEREADRIGIELAAPAGYAPQAAVSIWSKMDRLEGGRPLQLIDSHPTSASRRDKMSGMVDQMRLLMPYVPPIPVSSGSLSLTRRQPMPLLH